jgi:hypothetical protein
MTLGAASAGRVRGRCSGRNELDAARQHVEELVRGVDASRFARCSTSSTSRKVTGTPKSDSNNSCSRLSSDVVDTPPRTNGGVHQRDVLDALPQRALRYARLT